MASSSGASGVRGLAQICHGLPLQTRRTIRVLARPSLSRAKSDYSFLPSNCQKLLDTMRVQNADTTERQGSGDPSPTRSKRRRVALGGEISEAGPSGSGDGKKALYHCNYCNRDISGIIRIKCAKCPDFDLCLECFSVGVEVTPHKSNHPYRVIDNLWFPLIHSDWMADEEILLLEAYVCSREEDILTMSACEGVEMYGLGNWGEVAEHVGTKNKLECSDHYTQAYMNSTCSPLPDLSHLAGKTKNDLLAIAKSNSEGKKSFPNGGDGLKLVKQETSISPSTVKVEEGRDRDSAGDRRSLTSTSKGLTGEKSLLKGVAKQEEGEGTGSQQMSYDANALKVSVSAARKAAGGQAKESFEVPTGAVEDGAHSNRSIGVKKPKPLLEDVKVGVNGTDQSGYNPKRDEFEPEYDNEAEQPLAEMDFKDTDTEIDRELKIRMLHIYNSRLDERKRRKEFILSRGLLNVKRQQVLDRKRSKEERELYNRARVFMRFHSQEEHENLLQGLIKERKLRQQIEELQDLRMAGCHTLVDGDVYGSDRKKPESEANARKVRESASYLFTSKATHWSNRYVSREKEGDPTSTGNLKDMKHRGASTAHHLQNNSMMSGKGARKVSSPLDLSGLLGAELLANAEQDLCSQLRLLPVHYLKMKEVLMVESMRKGSVRRSDGYRMFKVDPSKTDHVFNLLATRGWIQEDNLLPPADR